MLIDLICAQGPVVNPHLINNSLELIETTGGSSGPYNHIIRTGLRSLPRLVVYLYTVQVDILSCTIQNSHHVIPSPGFCY